MLLKRKKRLWIFIISLPLWIFLIFFVFFKSETKKSRKHTYEQVLSLYKNQKFNEASSILGENPYLLLSMDDGCDLVLSIYAQLKAHEKILPISKKCIELNHKSGIAFEAIAFSYFEQSLVSQGIQLLSGYSSSHPHDRAFSSLLELYILDKNFEMARKTLLKLIDFSHMWQSWLSRYLKKKEIFEDKYFFTQLLQLINSKEELTVSLKESLEKMAKPLKIDIGFLYNKSS